MSTLTMMITTIFLCIGSHPSTRDPIALEAADDDDDDDDDDEYKETDNDNVFVFFVFFPLHDSLSTPRRNGRPPTSFFFT